MILPYLYSMISIVERNRVRNFILQELLKGSIDIGDRLSLPAISKKLQCSVTPVREALTQLEYAKVIEVIPNRGFIIQALHASEAKHLYEMIAALETLALEQSHFTETDIKYLNKLQKKFEKAAKPAAKIAADMDFHEALTKNYNNPFTQQIIRDLKIRIFFYEKKYMGNNDLTETSLQQHRQIIIAVENNDLRKASKILKQNWIIMLKYLQKNIQG
jgi:DNA-binding GntR family transcriptional regulator